MGELEVVRLDELVDGQKIRFPAILYLVIAVLVLASDGFDMSAIGYVAPELVKEWHISPAALAPVFLAGILGLFLGAPILGTIGDRIGRRKAILIGLCLFGGVTLATMMASTPQHFIILRFITGLGLGGVIPNVTALTAEIAPKRFRGSFIVIVAFGVAAGIALAGGVAAGFVQQFGWPVLLLVGGCLPLSVAAISYFLLPESIKYLAARPDRQEEVRRIARRLRPDLEIGNSTRFEVPTSRQPLSVGSPKGLFAHGLWAITPLLWIALAANQMTNFFVMTWLPTLLQQTGASISSAGISGSMFSLGGMVGGVILLFLIDRFGVIPLVVFFVLGAPLIAAIGISGLSPTEQRLIIGGAGFCVTGVNLGLTAALGMVYPTPIRSMGAGWAQAAGRLGALVAPAVGGALLGLHFSVQKLLLAPAASLVIGALACMTLLVLCIRRFQSYTLNEFAATAPQPAAPSLVLTAEPDRG